MKITRRNLIKTGIGVSSLLFLEKGLAHRKGGPFLIRPPGAKNEDNFYKSCIRCLQCGDICPNSAIKHAGPEKGIANLFTPYIVPREQGCMLCMKCTQTCPTDALKKIPDNPDRIKKEVKMGVAKLDTSLCYSYNGKICGVCYYSCPFPDTSLKLKSFARPVINPKECVGCGLCERACIHIPQAVRVYPRNNDSL